MRIKKLQIEKRHGFTILELIIVIAIIAILAALATGVAMRFFGIQQQRNTEVTITKAWEPFKRQWDEVISEANQEKLPPDGPSVIDPSYSYSLKGIYLTQILPLAGGDPQTARVLWVKARLRQQFPMDFTEILAATPPSQLYVKPPSPPPTTPPGWQPLPLGALPALPAYYNALNNAAAAAGLNNVLALAANPPTDAENSSCLLMALSETRAGIAFNSDNVGSSAIGDTDNNGLLEILDGWKKPLRFYRWPTGNLEVDALNPARPPNPLANDPGDRSYQFRDPQDPNGLLLGFGWWNNTHTAGMNGTYPMETLFHPIFILSPYMPSDTRNVPSNPNYTALGPYPAISPPFGTLTNPAQYNPYYVVPHSYYTMPVIASAGPNKSFGLSQPGPAIPNPMSSDGTGDDNDNIYSYRLKLGAPGN